MKTKFLISGALAIGALIVHPAFGTTANTLSDFGGVEEPAVIYTVATNSFASDSFVNITDEGGGVFKMYLRFSTSSWDGDRTTTSTDRQRAEVKVLGNRQAPGETYEYASTWRTDPAMTVGNRFCHITQVKAYDGNDTSDPLVATTLYPAGVAKAEKCSHDDTGLIGVRTFSWTPNTWTRVVNRLTTSSSDGASDGALLSSVNGDSFTGVSGTPMYRATATQYQPKWGLYRGVDVNQTFGNDYMEHSNVTANKVSSVPVADPTFSPAGGTYTSVQTVAISSTTSGASIRYTTDGSTPSETSGTPYTGPLNISSTTTVQAIAYESAFPDSNVVSATYTINLPKAATPTFNPVGGTYNNNQTVAISSATSGASINYTTDGSAPTETHGSLYSTPLTISSNITLQALAYESGFIDSSIGLAPYTLVVAPITFSPAAGTYTSSQSVTLGTLTTGATIRYTTDGSTPSETAGTIYSSAISVGATTTIKALAFKSGYGDSPVGTAAYTINLPQAAAPSFSPAAGTYTSVQTVTITSATSGASIRYTTDGSTPSETVGTIGSSVTISSTTTLKAIAYASGFTDSPVSTAAYTINLPQAAAPAFSPAGGTYTSTQTVTITSATSGASIRYTTDGSTPSETAGTVYSSPVSVSSSKTLKAIAYKSGFTDSAVTSAAYTINVTAPTLNFEAESLTYTASGATASVQTDTNSSGGKWIELAGNSTGDYINFTTPSIVAGTYQLKMEWKGNNTRGTLQLSVDGTNLGSKLDQYSSGQTYPTTTFGNVTFSSAGTHTIRLTVTGKNSASSSYQLSADKFTLVGQ